MPPSKKQAAHTKAVKKILLSSSKAAKRSFLVNDLETLESSVDSKPSVVENDSDSDVEDHDTIEDYLKEGYEMLG